jgi:predicted DNA-binding antitoxin AbrB/MazE fold protein
MSQELHAIYEHGMLRPLTPLNLPEATEVIVTLREAIPAQETRTPADPLLGLMSDEPELLDAVVEEAMLARESVAAGPGRSLS